MILGYPFQAPYVHKSAGRDTEDVESRRKMEVKRVTKSGKENDELGKKKIEH
jgi:hypothetical protein